MALLFALACLLVEETGARTVYVSTAGDDWTAEAGNPKQPFASLTLACETLRNGDRLEIAQGIYEIVPGYPNQWYSLPDFAPLQLKNLTNVTIAGIGSVEIFGRGPGDFLMIEVCTNIRVENITFRGDRPKIPEGGSLFSTVLLRAENEGLHFENCRFIAFGNHGISQLFGPKWSHNTVITNCYFADGGDGETEPLGEDGAAISGISSGSLIANNYIERCYRGIEIEGAFGFPVTNITIRGNTVTNCHTFGIMLFGTGAEGHEYSDITIVDNKILNMQNDPTVQPYPRFGFGIWLTAGENVVVANNLVDGFDFGGGISVTSAFLPVRDIVVASNTVKNVALRGIQVYQQYSNSLENASIRGNRAVDCGDEGILVNGKGIECVGNIVEDCGYSGIWAGIQIANEHLGSSQVSLVDNSVRNTAQSITAYGVGIEAGARDTFLIGNLFSSLASNAILDRGLNTKILPKIISIKDLDGMVSVTFTGRPSVRRNLQFSRDYQTWTTITNGVSSRDGILTLLHDVSELERIGGARRRPLIYRVEAPQ